MKKLLCVALVLGLAGLSSARAEEFKSGLQVGDAIGAFNVTKAAGAAEDGVKVGDNLCYRCKNGARPQVMIFTRATDEKVVALVKKLDAALEKNSDKNLVAFVNVLGESQDAASEDAKKFAESTGAKLVAFVVPNEVENGPEDYGINAKAAVTVIFAQKGKVKGNYSAAEAKELDAEKVVADIVKNIEE